MFIYQAQSSHLHGLQSNQSTMSLFLTFEANGISYINYKEAMSPLSVKQLNIIESFTNINAKNSLCAYVLTHAWYS